jgi:hypothetical protein
MIEDFTCIDRVRENWVSNEEGDVGKFKRVFQKFSLWHLKEGRTTRYILNGKMENKKLYIDYKNKIMMNYVTFPDKFKRR